MNQLVGFNLPTADTKNSVCDHLDERREEVFGGGERGRRERRRGRRRGAQGHGNRAHYWKMPRGKGIRTEKLKEQLIVLASCCRSADRGPLPRPLSSMRPAGD